MEELLALTPPPSQGEGVQSLRDLSCPNPRSHSNHLIVLAVSSVLYVLSNSVLNPNPGFQGRVLEDTEQEWNATGTGSAGAGLLTVFRFDSAAIITDHESL